MRKWYAGLLTLFSPIVILTLAYKTRHYPGVIERVRAWLGFGNTQLKPNGIWFHASSVGEVNALSPLLFALLKQNPDLPLTLTTQTPTGQSTAKQLFQNSIHIEHCPLDITSACKRFIARCKPHLVIIMETEIWPNLLASLDHAHIPVVLANARISEKSKYAYQKWEGLFQPALKSISHVIAQTEQDALQFLQLGIARNNLSISGNLKFDCTTDPKLKQKGIAIRQQIKPDRFVWIAASIHDWEEEAILDSIAEIQAEMNNVFCILVPRHPERFAPLTQKLKTRSYRFACISEQITQFDHIDVLLVDTMGQLSMLYYASDVAFVGGSLFAKGQGHNPLEAIVANCAITTGLHTASFHTIYADLDKLHAIIRVENQEQLSNEIIQLLRNSDVRNTFTQHAGLYVKQHLGATEKHLNIINQYLN